MTQKFYFKDAATEESAKIRGVELLEGLTKILHLSYDASSEEIIESVRRCLESDDDPVGYSSAWEEVGEVIEREYDKTEWNPDENMKGELIWLFQEYLRLKDMVTQDLGSKEALREYFHLKSLDERFHISSNELAYDAIHKIAAIAFGSVWNMAELYHGTIEGLEENLNKNTFGKITENWEEIFSEYILLKELAVKTFGSVEIFAQHHDEIRSLILKNPTSKTVISMQEQLNND